jgi:glycosyltransferase involved in cell wall biosynthesis
MIEDSGKRAAGPAILQIVPALESGGAERSTIEIADALARAGFVPLVASAGGRMTGELRAAGGEWIPMPMNAKSPLALIANGKQLRQLIRARNVRLIHARSRAPAWSALWAARRTGTPFVTTFHGAYSAGNPFKRFYNSVMLRGDAVIANSHWTAEHIRTDYSVRPKKLVVIRRGVDLHQFDPLAVSMERISTLRAAWDARPSNLVVLLPGRMTRRKGQQIFIEAIARLAKMGRLENVRAVLVGDGQTRNGYAAEIEHAISRHGLRHAVLAAGHVADMPAAYLAADIVVTASTEPEAFGRVAAEAGAMERPVIASDQGGARETVLPGVSGFLVPPGDSLGLANALGQMIAAGADGRAAFGAKGRAHVRANFTLERMTGETLTLYRELLGAETG